MSRNSIATFSIAILGFCSVSAMAVEKSGFYVGADYGQIKTDDGDFSSAKNGALTFGYVFSENFAVEGQVSQSLTDASFSYRESGDITFDTRAQLMANGYTYSQAVAAVKSATYDSTVTLDAGFDSYAIYGVYKTSGQFYGKVKAGIASVKATVDANVKGTATVVDSTNKVTSMNLSNIDTSSLGSGSDTETKFSVGIGAGYKITENTALELEYTALTKDLNYLSFGLKYSF